MSAPGEYNNIITDLGEEVGLAADARVGQVLLFSFEFQDDVNPALPPELQEIADQEGLQFECDAVTSKSIASPGGLVYTLFGEHQLDLETFNIAVSFPGEDLPDNPVDAYALFVALFDPVQQQWELIIRRPDNLVIHRFEEWPHALDDAVVSFVREAVVGPELSAEELAEWRELHPGVSYC